MVYSDSLLKMVYMKGERKRQRNCECINDVVCSYLHYFHTELHTVYNEVQGNQLHEITPNFQL